MSDNVPANSPLHDAACFERASRTGLEEQRRLLDRMRQDASASGVVLAGEDALGAMATDMLMEVAARVEKAAGALEAESARHAIGNIDQSLERYKELLERKKEA